MWPFASSLHPTAHRLPDETAATPLSPLPTGGLGVGIMLQALPFQCSVIVEPALVSGFCWLPTAQMSFAEIAATPRREMKPPLTFIEGADTLAQVVPFQCSTMSDTLGLVWTATAQTLLAARA